MMTPKKGGLQDKLNAAMERMNAGRQAKLAAKSEIAADQGNLKKAAKLQMRSKKVALRSEKRQAISDAKKGINPMAVSPTGKYVPRGINEAMQEYTNKYKK